MVQDDREGARRSISSREEREEEEGEGDGDGEEEENQYGETQRRNTRRSMRDRSASGTSNSRRRLRAPRFTSKYLRFAQRRRDQASSGAGGVSSTE